MIEISNLTKSYGRNETYFQALQNISLKIESGETVAIVGKSGSGKSTLMHCISGLDTPQQGSILIDGQNIFQLKDRQIDRFRASTMGFVFQSFFVQGNETCYDNVSLPLEAAGVANSERRAMIVSALTSVDLADKLHVPAKNLSGGQKQRLAIARAIVNKPSILFADEPTGNLDSQTGEMIEQLLFDYNHSHQATLIIVTHDLDIARKCRKKIYLKDGQIDRIDEQAAGKRRAS